MSPRRTLTLALLASGGAAAAAQAEPVIDRCVSAHCEARLTPQQLVDEVQALVAAGRYAEAKPMLAALGQAPGMALEYRFLTGYVAQRTGDLDHAAQMYRAILTDDPNQTRVRLELARVMMAQGKSASADRMFRLAQQDGDLPPELARNIRSVRDAIRSKRAWTFDVDVGIAPDTNINNATGAQSVDVLFGDTAVPLTLNQDARAKSGVGITGSVDAGLRLPLGQGRTLMLVDGSAFGNDYPGKAYDDYSYELAAGPEFKLSDLTRLRVEAVGAQRDYGGLLATRQAGLKTGLETSLSFTQKLGLQLDMRRTFAKFDNGYSGWNAGVSATYERAIAKAAVASGGLFVRRDQLRSGAYSNVEVGTTMGVGGEVPWGFDLSLAGSASRALYDAPAALFSTDPRRDWRFNARLTIGNRALRWQGFSPSVEVSWGDIDSSLDFYAMRRLRCRFALARYF